jgi:hypothetical protein
MLTLKGGVCVAQNIVDCDRAELVIAERVQTYFQQPPPEPDCQLGEQLQITWQ